MFEVRIHGRGGQGVVTAAELLSVAAFLDGAQAQAFPSFGPERTGAPIVAFCRIERGEIRTREPIMEPDAIIIADPTLLHIAGVFDGLKQTTIVLLNSSHGAAEFDVIAKRIVTIPATELALKHIGKPLPNAILLGGLAAATEIVTLASVQKAILQRFAPDIAEGNSRAAEAAYASVKEKMGAGAGAGA